MARSLALLLLLPASSCSVAGIGAPSPAIAARARVLRIEDTRRDEPAYLDSLLTATDPPTRALAALAVGRIGAVVHAPLLRSLAMEGDSAVAANALFSLGLLKDTASLAVARTTLRMTGPRARETAWLLGELGDRGRSAIVAGLQDQSLASSTRSALLLAAARLRPIPTEAIVPLLGSLDTALSWRAAYAIARGRGTAGVRALLTHARSTSDALREQVARGASRSLAGDSLAGDAQSALVLLAQDASARVRMNAVRSLATYGASSRVAMFTALEDSDVNVRLSAAQSLEPVIGGDSTAWFRAFDADTTFIVRRSLAESAARRGIDLPSRARWSSSSDWQRRGVAAELSGAGSADEALRRVSPWLRDSDGRVRAIAIDALRPLADSTVTRSAARSALRAALDDSDVAVRANSLASLRRGASVEDFSAALKSYQSFTADRDNDARLAFWHLADTVITRAGSSMPDSLTRALSALPRPNDPLERAAASAIPRFATWRDSTSPAQSLSWYEERAREASRPAPTLSVETERGTIELSLFESDAPLTVYNIVTLARRGYFDGQRFHRVVPNFVVQAGDPRGDGNGGPGYAIRDELNRRRYERGTLGMALSGPNTGGSQFFVTHSPQPHLDGGYTVFGQLVSGFDVLDRIIQGDRIVRVSVH